MDELDRRLRSLEAERLRPVPARAWHPNPHHAAPPERLRDLIAEVTLADGRTNAPRGPAADRIEDYVFLRRQGEPMVEAARRVGVLLATARQYEQHVRDTA